MEQSQPAVRGQGLLEWYEALISAALVLVLVFSFFFRIIQVDGESMVPTLENGDKLVVWPGTRPASPSACRDSRLYAAPEYPESG